MFHPPSVIALFPQKITDPPIWERRSHNIEGFFCLAEKERAKLICIRKEVNIFHNCQMMRHSWLMMITENSLIFHCVISHKKLLCVREDRNVAIPFAEREQIKKENHKNKLYFSRQEQEMRAKRMQRKWEKPGQKTYLWVLCEYQLKMKMNECMFWHLPFLCHSLKIDALICHLCLCISFPTLIRFHLFLH